MSFKILQIAAKEPPQPPGDHLRRVIFAQLKERQRPERHQREPHEHRCENPVFCGGYASHARILGQGTVRPFRIGELFRGVDGSFRSRIARINARGA